MKKKLFFTICLSIALLMLLSPSSQMFAGENNCTEETTDDTPEDAGGSGVKPHYKREVFRVVVSGTQGIQGGGGSYSSGGYSFDNGYVNVENWVSISCCHKAIFNKTCDFSIDDNLCKKYIDSESYVFCEY